MTLINLLKRSEKLAIDNSPAILTGLGITGTVVTAYLTGTATVKAVYLLDEEKIRRVKMKEADGFEIETKEAIKVVWRCYIPPVIIGVGTIACILGANRVGTRRAAAVAAAYSISEKAFSEYKEKVIEKIGAPKERAIRDEVAQDQINRHPVSREIVIMGKGEVLCYDSFTGRYFNSDVESIKKAQNDLNHRIMYDSYASLSDFYDKIGLTATSMSEEVGWNSDRLMEVEFSACVSEDGRPAISIGFVVAPIRNYYKMG